MRKQLSFKLCRFFTNCSLLVICLFPPSSYAGGVTEQDIKVGFIYNFSKFVTWLNISDNTTTPLVICTNASQELLAKIAMLNTKKINARTIEVHALGEYKPTSCNLIFFSTTEDNKNKKKLLETLATLPILTVSDSPNFVQEGGMIGMKELDNRLRFDINLSATKKAGLSVSSQLLQLADEILQ